MKERWFDEKQLNFNEVKNNIYNQIKKQLQSAVFLSIQVLYLNLHNITANFFIFKQ